MGLEKELLQEKINKLSQLDRIEYKLGSMEERIIKYDDYISYSIANIFTFIILVISPFLAIFGEPEVAMFIWWVAVIFFILNGIYLIGCRILRIKPQRQLEQWLRERIK